MTAEGMHLAQALGAHCLGERRDLTIGHAGRQELGLRRLDLGIEPVIDARRRMRHHQPAGGKFGRGFGQTPAPSLVRRQRLAEGGATLAVFGSDAQRLADHAASHRSDVGARAVDRGHRRFEGQPGRLQHFVVGSQIAVEREAAGTDGVLASQIKTGLMDETGPPGIDHEAGNPARTRAGLGLGKEDHDVGDGCVHDPGLASADAPAAINLGGQGLDGTEVGSGMRLGQRGAADQLAGDQARHIAGGDLGHGIAQQLERDVLGIDQRHRKTEVGGGQSLGDLDLHRKRQPQPAMFARRLDTAQAKGGGLIDRLASDAPFALPDDGAGRHHLAGKGTDALEQRGLVNRVFECVVHGLGIEIGGNRSMLREA